VTVSGVQENDSKIENEEHDHTNTARRVINIGSLVGIAYDYIGVAYPVDTTEVYTYRSGGVAGTVVATITVVYTNSYKTDVSSVARS
jgi:hypothetical protein